MTALAAPQTPAAPRLTRRRAALILAAGLPVLGCPIAALWAAIAPPIHGVVALTHSGEHVMAYLGNEADHLFVAPSLLLGLLVIAAVVAATVAWQWRAHRGPGMVAGLSVGVAAMSGLAALIGALTVHHRYGTVDVDAAPVTPAQRVYYVTQAPPVFYGHSLPQIAATILLPVAAAAVIYGLCATWSARDDLGGYPPEPTPPAMTRTTTTPRRANPK